MGRGRIAKPKEVTQCDTCKFYSKKYKLCNYFEVTKKLKPASKNNNCSVFEEK